ncbi:MAG TPA: hypothetical protein VJ870_12485 [Amycolatopsis sp.]|nr:hypothetical protein [Amycolatopsis sp.]
MAGLGNLFRLRGKLLCVALSAAALAACTSPAPAPPPTPPPAPFVTAILDAGTAGTAQYGYQLVDVTPVEIGSVPDGQQAFVWLGGYDNNTCSWSWSDAQIVALFSQYHVATARTAGYFLADEPNTAGTCPSAPDDVRARALLVRSLDPDPRHFTFANIDDPAQFRSFRDTVDVLGTDPYPCRAGRSCDWSLIPRYVAALQAAGVRRYLPLLQAFGAGNWRWPTGAELGNMIAQWQRSSWSGEITFSWSYGGGHLSDHPDLLTVLRQLNYDPLFPFPQPGR